jgi:hypothetical protein
MSCLCHSEAWRAMRSQHDRKTSRPWEPQRSPHEAQSPAAKRPEGDLGGFLLDTVPRWDVRRFSAPYETATRGAPPFAPAMLGCLWRSAYGVGVCSRRKIALAGARTLACRALVGTERPDFRTIRACRPQPLEACKDVLVHVGRLAGAAGLVLRGTVSTEGTNIQGHASRHQAMRDGAMNKAGERRREAMEALVTAASQQAEAEEAAVGSRRGDALPAELARREERVAQREEARRRLAAHAKREADAARQRRAATAAERQRTGKTRQGKGPKAVDETPADKAQTTCTDPALGLRRMHNKGWEYCGNAPASVDGACQILLASDVVTEANAPQQAKPLAEATRATLAQAGRECPKGELGAVQSIPATVENGSDSEAAGAALETCGCAPSLATGRPRHQAPQAESPEAPATAQERMAAKVRTPEGKAVYARRQGIVEPVCGQIKAARGCRRFLRRGAQNIRGAWRLVCLTQNLLKIWRDGRVLHAVSVVWRLVYGLEMALRRASWR